MRRFSEKEKDDLWLDRGIDVDKRLIKMIVTGVDKSGEFDGAIDARSLDNLVTNINFLEKQSKKPITILLNTCGGAVIEGLGIVDYLQEPKRSKIEVQIIGQCSSIGVAILQSADVRSIYPNANIYLHQGSPGSSETDQDAIVNTKYKLRFNQGLWTLLERRTSRSYSFWKKEATVTAIYNAKEALSLKLVDKIVHEGDEILIPSRSLKSF